MAHSLNAELPILPPVSGQGKHVSLALAIFVHLVLATFLFYGVHWQTKVDQVVEVELVSAASLADTPPPQTTVSPAPTPEPIEEPIEPKPTPNPVQPKITPPEPVKKIPPPQPAKPDIAVKEKELPPRIDPLQMELAKEAEKLKKIKQENVAQQELDKVKTAQLAQATSARNKAVANYISKIISAIKPRINLPPDLKGNPEAVFLVTQLPSGDIIAVKLKRSSGNPILDINIERAILKSSPLPKPDQSDIFNRDLELKFRPLDD